MSQNTNNTNKIANQSNQNTNTSSLETQKELRIKKVNDLKSLGFEPFPVYSKRDYSIGFVKFWFNIVHKFDFTKITPDGINYLVEHYLYQGIFPPTLLETFEEKIQMRHTARQMGLDPDDKEEMEETVFDEELINEIRSLLPELSSVYKEQREKFFEQFIVERNNELPNEDMLKDSDDMEMTLKPNQEITLAGRIKIKRTSGKIAFLVLEDESCPEGLQLIFKKDTLEKTLQQRLTEIFCVENITSKLNLN